MKILFLSKRAYTNKDLVKDRYGRVYEFSRVLAAQGHGVCGVALDYHRGSSATGTHKPEEGNPEWHSFNLFPNPVTGIRDYLRGVAELVENVSPDILVSVSDVYHVIFGDWAARKYNIPHVTDLYDNYECFGAARVPGLIALFRRAVARAEGCVCVSHQLKKHVLDTCNPKRIPEVIINAVDTDLFRPHDSVACRRHFGLPENQTLIGLGGSLTRIRGVQTVFDAHRSLINSSPDIHLVLAGSKDVNTTIPDSEYIHYLGNLDYTEMPLFFGSLDLGIIINRDTPFARFCFPQKFFEMLACELPIVVASTGDVKDMMERCSHALFRPGSDTELLSAIRKQLAAPCRPRVKVATWEQQGAVLEEFLKLCSGTG